MQLPWPNLCKASIEANKAMLADRRAYYSWDEWRALCNAALKDGFIPGFTAHIIKRLTIFKDKGYSAQQVHEALKSQFGPVEDLL